VGKTCSGVSSGAIIGNIEWHYPLPANDIDVVLYCRKLGPKEQQSYSVIPYIDANFPHILSPYLLAQ
jgi:hypothetical protein